MALFLVLALEATINREGDGLRICAGGILFTSLATAEESTGPCPEVDAAPGECGLHTRSIVVHIADSGISSSYK